MFLSKDRQKFARGTGILILIQGLTWFALSIAGIVFKKSPPDKLTQNDMTDYTSYSDYLSRIIYNDFLIESTMRDGKVIRPADFEAFLWIYAILSAVWVAASLDQNFAIKYHKPRQSYSTLVLGIAILVTSVIDLVFVSLLARDFATCPFNITAATTVSTTMFTTGSPTTIFTTLSTTAAATATAIPTTSTAATTSPTSADDVISVLKGFDSSLQFLSQASTVGTFIDCQVANGIVMSLGARGYVLWLINVILGICLIHIGAKVLKTPALLTYGTATIPRVRMPDQKKGSSPSNDLAFFGDTDVFAPPVPPMTDSRNRNSTPIALNNKNQNIYY